MLLCSWQHSHHCGDYNLQDRNACSTGDISEQPLHYLPPYSMSVPGPSTSTAKSLLCRLFTFSSFTSTSKPPGQPTLSLRRLLLHLPINAIHIGVKLVPGAVDLLACFLGQFANPFVGFGGSASIVDLPRLAIILQPEPNTQGQKQKQKQKQKQRQRQKTYRFINIRRTLFTNPLAHPLCPFAFGDLSTYSVGVVLLFLSMSVFFPLESNETEEDSPFISFVAVLGSPPALYR